MTLQDRATTLANHRRFVERVIASGQVWGLKSAAGWAVSESTADTEDDQARTVMPFWSDRAYAKRAAADQWRSYVPTAIALDEFIGAWLEGMHRDGVLVGTNWDAHLCGVETEPLELAGILVEALKNADVNRGA